MDLATITAWLVLLPESVTIPSAALRSMLAESDGERSFATTIRFSANRLRLFSACPNMFCNTRCATSRMSPARSRRYSSSISENAWM